MPEFLVHFFHAIDKVAIYTPYAALLLLVAAIIVACKNGFKNKPLAPYVEGKGPGKWAWICVAVLWVVVMLNYADRQLLSTLNKSITDPNLPGSIEMTQAEFGLITSIFLVIYACLSPIGGFLADRFSRKTIIMCSLVVWSLATWFTGMADSFNTLLAARAAMGISEAFYIPAALALISDYHRGGTRSMATGLHMSGIYAGQAIAGYGAMVSGDPTNLGWHATFEVFGAIGVIYGLIVIIFLRDPEAATPEQMAAAKTADPANAPASTNFTVGEALDNLFSTKAMWLLIGVVSLSGFANWFIMNWYPRLLQDTYGMTEAAAGPAATGPVNIVKYFAVLIAAAIADRWSRSNPNARAIVPAAAFLISGPCIIIAMLPSLGIDFLVFSASVAIGLVAMQGLAQGALDANLMPVLRSQIDERFSATGYGMLNLTSVGAGALVSYMGGVLLDMNVPLSAVMVVSGAFIFIAAFFLIAMRAKKASA
ncbi:MAG: MFS transporter [Akkermansia sp.]